MTQQEALQIAAIYKKKRGHQTQINPQTFAMLYESFQGIDGAAWIIEAALPPSNFEGSDTLTYVVSVNEGCVKYIINSSGFPSYPEQAEALAFTPEELQQLRDWVLRLSSSSESWNIFYT